MENTARYEVLVLVAPEITQDETKDLEKQIDRTVTTAKGSIISFERWGKYRLAFPVNKNDYGDYFLVRFQGSEGKQLVEDLRTLFALRFENIVMRSIVTALDKDVSLEYQRPRSLEEAPAREEGTFSKDRRPRSFAESSDVAEQDADQEDVAE